MIYSFDWCLHICFDYDNPTHRPDRTTASTTARTRKTTTAVSIRFGSNHSHQTITCKTIEMIMRYMIDLL